MQAITEFLEKHRMEVKREETNLPTVKFAQSPGSECGHRWLCAAILAMAFSTIDILNGDGALERVRKDIVSATDKDSGDNRATHE